MLPGIDPTKRALLRILAPADPLESPTSRDIFVDFSCMNQVDDATENVDPFSTPSDQEEEEEEEDFEEEVEEEFEEEVDRFSNPSDHKEEEGGEEGEEEEEEEEEEEGAGGGGQKGHAPRVKCHNPTHLHLLCLLHCFLPHPR